MATTEDEVITNTKLDALTGRGEFERSMANTETPPWTPKPQAPTPTALPSPQVGQGEYDPNMMNYDAPLRRPGVTGTWDSDKKATAGAAELPKPAPGTSPINQPGTTAKPGGPADYGTPKSELRALPVQAGLRDKLGEVVISNVGQPRLGGQDFTDQEITGGETTIQPAQALPQGGFQALPDGTKQYIAPTDLAAAQGKGSGQMMVAMPSDAASQALVAARKAELHQLFEDKYHVNLGKQKKMLENEVLASQVRQHNAAADSSEKRAAMPGKSYHAQFLIDHGKELTKRLFDPLTDESEKDAIRENLSQINDDLMKMESSRSSSAQAPSGKTVVSAEEKQKLTTEFKTNGVTTTSQAVAHLMKTRSVSRDQALAMLGLKS